MIKHSLKILASEEKATTTTTIPTTIGQNSELRNIVLRPESSDGHSKSKNAATAESLL